MRHMQTKRTKRRTRARREDAEIERAYRSASRGGKYQKRKKRRSGKTSATATTCIALLILAAIICGCIYIFNAGQKGVIADGITIAGVDVGGLTQSEAIRAVNQATKDTYKKTPMSVTVLETQIQIDPKVSNASLNVRKAVRAAFTSDSEAVVDITKFLNLDEDAIKEELQILGAKYSSTLSQSKYEVTGTAPNQVLIVNLGTPEYGLDMNALYQKVLDAYNNNVFAVTGECGQIIPEPVDLQGILDKYYVAPIDATFDKKTFSVVEGVDGYGYDVAEAEKKLADAGYGSTVEIKFSSIPPKVTAQSLTDSLYKDTLSTLTATSESEPDRDTNLRLACEAINGVVINPGEVFSYNNALGERTSARGYKPGPSYANGKTTTTIGGGICQVSSCLYNCVLLADLEIINRRNHSFTVDYVKLGLDAAVSWGTLDFRFKNNTDLPIRIEASAEGGVTTVSLIGTDTKDYYVEMEYDVLSTLAYETTYQTLPSDNKDGYKNGDYIIEPHTGYSVQTYRCKYNKETKERISREKEDGSYYQKCDAVVCVIEGSSGSSQGIGNGSVTDSDGRLP